MYIRKQEESRVGYEIHQGLKPLWDLQTDWVMIWGVDQFLAGADSYREKGYVVNLMYTPTFSADSACREEYMSGKWDGKEHWDEIVMFRDGNPNAYVEGDGIAYMIPSESYIEWLAMRLRAVVDAGADGIYFIETEISDNAGYSEAFKKSVVGDGYSSPPHDAQ